MRASLHAHQVRYELFHFVDDGAYLEIGGRNMVVGFLCDEGNEPVSVEVFPGNTSDLKTFIRQIAKWRAGSAVAA
jgi:hypothetical protein